MRKRTDLGKLCGVLTWLFGHLAHFASRSVIIEELERPHAARCDREGAHHGTRTQGPLTFLFRLLMWSFIAGKYEFIFPRGSKMVVR